MARAKPPAIFFDLDGTLIDSAPDLGGAAEQMLAARGLPTKGLDAYRLVASAGARGILKVAFDVEPSAAHYEDLRLEFLANYERCMADNTYAFAGVTELLQGLQERSIAWGIITNKSIHLARLLVQRMPILQGAVAVVGGDSAEHAKPHAAPMLLAGREAGVDMRACWYVGDDKRDIDAARAANMACAIAARWGYVAAPEVASWQADIELDQPLDLLAQL